VSGCGVCVCVIIGYVQEHSLPLVASIDRALTIRFVRSLLLTLVALMRDNVANQV
jgi:hypothetical protein